MHQNFDGYTPTAQALSALSLFDFDDNFKIAVKEHPDYMVVGVSDSSLIQPNGKPAYCHIRLNKDKMAVMSTLEVYYWISRIFEDWAKTVGTNRYNKFFINGRKSPGQPPYKDWN